MSDLSQARCVGTFRAIWPITDETIGALELIRSALPDVPMLAAQAGARLTGGGRFAIEPSANVPGSGRVTEWVLLYEARAAAIDRRPYRKAS